MTALSRQEAKIFAINALASQVTAFRTTESDTPSTTKIPNAIQNEKYLQGWLNPDNTGNVLPFAEDMNGVFLTLSYNTAYLYEKGIPEYSASQTYYENSFCQYEGKLYRCKVDGTINYVPTNTSKWDEVPTTSYSITNIGTGAKVYNESVTGPNFQLKTLVAGSNVTLTEGDDSITIAASGGGGTTITASAPLDLTNNVLSIPAATSSQGGYLTAADWTSFNSKLSSTIFSSSNTWTASNNFSNILPRANNTYTLGSGSYAWTEVYTNYLLSNSNDHLVIGNTTDLNRVLVNYITNGGEWGIFPDTISGTESYLGNSTYLWDHIFADSSNIVTELNIGKSSAAIASNRILIKGFSETTAATFANIGYWGGTLPDTTSIKGFAFYPETTQNSLLGVRGSPWTYGFIDNLYSTAISTTSIVTTADNTYSIGGSGTRFKEIWCRIVQHSDRVHTYSQGNNYAIEWYNGTTSASRSILADYDAFFPYQNNTIDLGKNNNRWNTIYYNTLNPPSDIRLKNNIQDLETGLDIINDLEIKSYTLKSNDNHIEYGVLAQEVVKNHPELVSIPQDDDGLYGIYIHNFIFASIKAIQELSAKVDDLQQQLMELKK